MNPQKNAPNICVQLDGIFSRVPATSDNFRNAYMVLCISGLIQKTRANCAIEFLQQFSVETVEPLQDPPDDTKNIPSDLGMNAAHAEKYALYSSKCCL